MATDQTLLHRFVISQLAEAGVDRGRLLGECGLPEWTLAGPGVYVPAGIFARVWELGEIWLEDPDVALHVAQRYELAASRLYDYLFASAATVGEALIGCGRYITAVTTNQRFDPVAADERETVFSLEMIEGAGRGRELVVLWGLGVLMTRLRRVVEYPLDPVRVSFRQPTPRRLEVFGQVFGSAALEFGASEDSVAFRASDLARPLATADPVLADVLQPLAESLPPLPPLAKAWPDRVARALADAFAEGEVSLEQVARRLATSPRTLQRRLADAGTTWRRELDRARVARAAAAGPLSREQQARLLGYSDAGSVRRAARRWSMVAPHEFSDALGRRGCVS
ncbi:MAG: AraC family transcriptional regulator ligand-binding domain-containing protein [Nocardia sp.]|nr:AraC family transcriptional regulator ligand-binding domain-containing protein [Nocardia sp.]